MRGTRALAFALLSFVVLAVAPVQAEDVLAVRQGYVVLNATMAPLLFQKRDNLRHYGKSYTVDAIHFAGTSPEIIALATGQLEIASLAYSSFANAVENNAIPDIRIVADGFQDGAQGYDSIRYMVKNDSPIRKIEDLKGKILGINTIGAAVDIGGRAVLKKHGLEFPRDYSIIEAPFPAIGAMLLEGKADIVSMVTPFLYAPAVQAGARTLFTMKDGMGTSQMIVQVSRESILQAHRAAFDDYFEDMVRGMHWMLAPANREAAVALAASASKLPPALLEPFYLTKRDSYRNPDGVPDLAAFQKNIDAQVEFGFLKRGFDVKKYADLSFVERAAKRVQTAQR